MPFHPYIVEKPDKDLRFIEIFFIVYPKVVLAKAAVPDVDHSGFEAVQADSLFLLCAKYQGLPLLQEQRLHGLGGFLRKDLESAVIENVTVLIDLQEGGTLVTMAPQQHLLKMFGVAVHAAGYKTSIGAHGKRQGIERMIDAAVRRRLGYLVLFRGGGILSLGQPIDLVVEQEDIDVKIPPEQMDGVIATDADVDGMHIRLLLMTFFLQFFPDLVKKEHVFVLETPLFRVRDKKETIYCYDEAEKQAAIKKLGGKPEITRFKGLGEISPDEFGRFIGEEMRLQAVILEHGDHIQNLLEYYMGKNTQERQEFIIENLKVEIDAPVAEDGVKKMAEA